MSKELLVRIIVFISLLTFSWIYINFLIQGAVSVPSEGDSLIIHIPLAKSFLAGHFLNPDPSRDIFYPAAVEMLLSIFILFFIPLNLFNVVGIFVLFFASLKLGLQQGFQKHYAYLLGISIILMHGITRWALSQKPDIWMLDFFVISLYFLFKKKRVLADFFLWGCSCGFFIGSKFTAPLFIAILFIVFYKKLSLPWKLKQLILFLVPAIFVGGFWYIRNFVITGNPLYFPGYSAIAGLGKGFVSYHALDAILNHPSTFMNAHFSEFMLWSFGIIILPILFFILRKNKKAGDLTSLIIVGSIFFVLYLFLPAGDNLTQMIGSLRYIFSGVALIILCLFWIAQEYKKESIILIVVITRLVFIPFNGYHPKLLIPIFLALFLVFLLSRKYKKRTIE